jgi:hypothetical protein
MKKTRIKEISINGNSKFYPQYLGLLGWCNYYEHIDVAKYFYDLEMARKFINRFEKVNIIIHDDNKQ